MHKQYYEQYDEVVYSKTLENGLKVQILPKKGFHKTYALFTTNYGSIDNHFIPRGEDEAIKVPDGIAHFLEHKLFEKEDEDVFQKFSRQGASANAFTSFTQTSYLFSTTENVKENLITLLDFVQEPYFTEETVEKEKGIIAQEILMYDDAPDWRLMFGLLENLYPNHPAATDIAGTVESIQEITAEMLHTCYETFYHPSNMGLTIVGQVEVEEIMDIIETNQNGKKFSEVEKIQRFFPSENMNDLIKERSETMEVSRPKVAMGIRGIEKHDYDINDLKKMLMLQMLMNLLFGQTSKTYLDLYDRGIIDDTFGAGAIWQRESDYVVVSGDVNNPEEAISEIKKILLNASESPELCTKNFELMKKRLLGQNLRSLNSVEYIARQLYMPDYGNITLFDVMPLVEDIELEDIVELAKEYLKEEYLSIYTIRPEIK